MPHPSLDAILSGSVDELVGSFFRPKAVGATPSPELVGLEHEKLGFHDSGAPMAPEGRGEWPDLLSALRARGYQPTWEGERVIALERGAEHITLEPGGQVEMAGPPLATAHAAAEHLKGHLGEVADLARPLGLRLMWGGFRPLGTLDDIPWFLKRRYELMRTFLPTRGRTGHEMMKRTATVQVNLDYADEDAAVAKMRTACGVTSIVTAMFASSPITNGKPNGMKSVRAAVWLDLDEARCGIPSFVFEPGFRLKDYAAWALEAPMFFVKLDSGYEPAPGLTFRRFLAEGFRGKRATAGDWELHLSTMFPEVRIKRTLELRGADAGPLDFCVGLGALWRGLLDDPSACQAAWELVRGVPMAERNRLRAEVPTLGLGATVGGHSLRDLAVQLCVIAADGLRRLPGGLADAALLAPLAAFAKQGRCPADDMLDLVAAKPDPLDWLRAWELAPAR